MDIQTSNNRFQALLFPYVVTMTFEQLNTPISFPNTSCATKVIAIILKVYQNHWKEYFHSLLDLFRFL